MRVVVQRVKRASCTIDGKLYSEIGIGYLLLVGFTHTDSMKEVKYLAKKIANLRVFEDENGKMNLSLKAVGGKILSISQFTLYADYKDGNRPAFINAMNPVSAKELYELFNEELKTYDISVASGIFGADMKIDLLNDGPVTIIYDENL